MDRLETIVVQLEEAKRLIARGRISHLRIALILLDNAAEVLMHRRLKPELRNDEFYVRLGQFIDGVNAPTEEKTAQKRKLGYLPISAGQKRKLDRLFGEKAQFLSRERDCIPKETADVLCYLHGYRNEAQHDDRVRPGSLRPAVVVLFEILCDLLVRLGQPTSYSSDGDYRWAEGYGINPMHPGLDACATIVARLREGLPLGIREIAKSLAAHVEDRVDAMVDGLEFISAPGVPHEETLKGLQFWNADRTRHPYDRGETFQEFKPQHTMESLARWRDAGRALEARDEKLALFRTFATIEQEMEPLEALVAEVARTVDEASQAMADTEIGK